MNAVRTLIRGAMGARGRSTLRSYCSSSAAIRRFTDKHEWVLKEKSSDEATVGISDYAQSSLGEVVFAQLPTPGTKVNSGDECGALESVKAASEIYSPISGTVTAKNQILAGAPSTINASCYGDGWLYRLKVSDPDEIDRLMTEEQYMEYLKTDAH